MGSGWGQDELSVAVIGCVIFAAIAIATVSSCPRLAVPLSLFKLFCCSDAMVQNASLIRKMFSSLA